MPVIGYFGRICSGRAIAWRCAESLSVREFLGFELTGSTPDRSTPSVRRKRLELEACEEVFRNILSIAARYGLRKGGDLSVDSTTLQANAAMHSIVHKDKGESYRE
jgi:transposase